MASPQVERVLAKLNGVRQEKDGWLAQCPAHSDEHASLRISEGDGGKALLYCRAGCSFEDVAKAMNGLVSPPGEPKTQSHNAQNPKEKPWGKDLTCFDYTDEHGTVLFQVVRDENKNFRQRKPTNQEPPAEPWTYNVNGVRNVLYRLPEVMSAASLKVRTFIVEGEKDANTLIGMGLVATTCRGGAGKWTEELTKQIEGRQDVTILPDNDPAGEAHAKAVLKALKGHVGRVRILRLQNLPPKGDVTDWVLMGGTREKLLELATAGPETRGWRDASEMVKAGVPDVNWIVKNLISRPSLCMITGDADTFKSWSVTQLCLAASTKGDTKQRWFGHFDVDAERAMLITADEDQAETLRKIGWLVTGAGLKHGDFQGRFLVWSNDLSFDDEESFERLILDVEDFRPDLLVVDHLRVCFDGNEDSSEFAKRVKDRGRQIHRVLSCGVIWMHHVRKVQKERILNTARQRSRGSGALIQSVDHHLAFERDDLGVATVTVDRNKKGRTMAPFCFDPRIVDSRGMANLEYKGDAQFAAGTSESPGEVLTLLRSEQKAWRTGEIVDRIKMPKATVVRSLRVLERDRLVLVDGTGKTTSYTARETTAWNWNELTVSPSHDRTKDEENDPNLFEDND